MPDSRPGGLRHAGGETRANPEPVRHGSPVSTSDRLTGDRSHSLPVRGEPAPRGRDPHSPRQISQPGPGVLFG